MDGTAEGENSVRWVSCWSERRAGDNENNEESCGYVVDAESDRPERSKVVTGIVVMCRNWDELESVWCDFEGHKPAVAEVEATLVIELKVASGLLLVTTLGLLVPSDTSPGGGGVER